MSEVMTDIPLNFSNPKKHRLAFDDDAVLVDTSFGKRMRLDSYFDSLSLTDTTRQSKRQSPIPSFEINPEVSSLPQKVPDLNTYIADKIIVNFNAVYDSASQVIKYYNRNVVIAHHFQRWVLRLFNRFIVKYNKNNHTNIPRFKHFFKITNVIGSQQHNLTYHDLISIVQSESHLEAKAINKRLSKPSSVLEEIEEESFTFNDIKYNYWDTIQSLDQDVEMAEESDGGEDVDMGDD
ncbi:hypothetical protein PSN45_002379 [Yamadazyma tenuis]|uniref:Uncharacterized protein n=1 Tax=Candida tenuis (strain ATCC 10573 / BCRC 21748 / CBS 615 / JCM 9827 / NBRC 10315 / NRRL Y-1498 / VKM Y-70) TaxID=590646 RepID=G3B0N9_CANTC|nr:uncharacterized protein CANTEDRAFT_113199 [Yamadazyma tenuis ATCC 10573]EGV65438.1 hypothetical protein CANTEDRAFT_113199 [Yamadazyma tenuis ATCC 10573]WEJ94879.1 hypothetical protein PSN45_002379 [Yamadazyma tenuis]